jgi:hypothetical protein
MKGILLISIVICLVNPVFGQKMEDSLFVFVGSKLSVNEFKPKVPDNQILMDQYFKVKYLIKKKVYGKFNLDTIEFTVADHYGFPKFAEYDNVILYAIIDSGKWYHVKYMYTPVYKTKNNKWAGIYQGRDYAHSNNENTAIKPVKIKFRDKITIDTTETKWKTFGNVYDPRYYKTKGNKGYPTHGNYVPALFELKKNGFLKVSGYFEDE